MDSHALTLTGVTVWPRGSLFRDGSTDNLHFTPFERNMATAFHLFQNLHKILNTCMDSLRRWKKFRFFLSLTAHHQRIKSNSPYIAESGQSKNKIAETTNIDPWRDKPRRSGRGRIARTAQPSLGFSAVSAAAQCSIAARWKWEHRRSLRRSRTATKGCPSNNASRCRAVPCATGGWRRP